MSFNAVHAEITWTLSDDGTLTISGTGEMDENPWDIYQRAKIKKVIIKNGITNIGECAFMYCDNLVSVTIPNSVTNIGSYAFQYCYNLASIYIPSSVANIGYSAFGSCTGLTSIVIEKDNPIYDSRDNCNAIIETKSNTLIKGCRNSIIPNSVTSVSGNAFFGTPELTSIIIPSSVMNIEGNSFGDCQDLSSIIVEDGNIKYDSRDNCNAIIETTSNTLISGCMNSIIPNNVTNIGYGAFNYCYNLTSINIPKSVSYIGDRAFYSCSGLTSVNIPNSITNIGNSIFAYCTSLSSVTIPESVTTIGERAFEHCYKLNEVVLPSTVTSLKFECFKKCSSLSILTCKALTPPSVEKAFAETPIQSGTLYVPASAVSAYKKAEGWKEWKNILAIPYNLKDGESYVNNIQQNGQDVSYTRTFNNTRWQALYIPFSLNYDDWKDDFEVAYINGIRQYDKNDDGAIDETIMDVIKIKEGSLIPNTPYLIKAKSVGEKTFSLTDATLYPAEENSIDCRTTIAEYTFTGTYSTIPSATLIANQYYAMGGGELIISDGSNDLKPYRWYMKIDGRSPMYNISNAAKAITINVVGEDSETTGIRQLQMDNDKSPVYDLNGRRVSENSLKPGMYIKNGKKVIIK